MRAKEFTNQGLTEGFEEKAQEYKSYLLKTLPQMMLFLKGVRGAPSEKQMLAAIDVAYDVMKRTGDVKQAAKAKKEFLARIPDQQGVAEDTVDNFNKRFETSVVKNSKGKPLLVYHGGTSVRPLRPNTFFTPDKLAAQQYADERGEGSIVTAAYLLIRNPADEDVIHSVAEELGIPAEYDAWIHVSNRYTDRRNLKIISKLKQMGYDGAHFVTDGAFGRTEIESWMPFTSDQIKVVDDIVKKDTVDEMALKTYKTMGDFSKPGPFRGPDKKLVPHPKNIEKATQFFEKTPFDFRLFFSNIPGTGKYSEHGPMTTNEIRKVFAQDAEEIINGSEDAITVVYVGNKGDRKVMLTPWMMAHRFGHAINAGARNQNWHAWGEAEKYFFQTVNALLEEHYSKEDNNPSPYMRRPNRPKSEQMSGNLTLEYNVLFNAMGTQRSSKTGQIRRPYEFMYELLAQYIGTGKITLNSLPTNLTYGRRVFGNPTKYMNIKPEYRDAGERQQAADSLAYTMELLFNDVLSDSVGKIFVM